MVWLQPAHTMRMHHHPFGGSFIWTELFYSLIVIFICLLIYWRTKELYELSGHEGIKHFRNTFMFFALAYAFQFVGRFVRISSPGAFDLQIMSVQILFFLFGVSSTLAVISLTYSAGYSRHHSKFLIYWLYAAAFVVLLLATVMALPIVFVLSQALLFVYALMLVYRKWSQKRQFSQMYVAYVLLFVFWILNVLALSLGRGLPELRFLVYAISAGLFLVILYGVLKSTVSTK